MSIEFIVPELRFLYLSLIEWNPVSVVERDVQEPSFSGWITHLQLPNLNIYLSRNIAYRRIILNLK